MQVNYEEIKGIAVFKMKGDIDINTSPEIKKSIDKAVKNRAGKIVIDLEEVGYVDSSGLATLVEILKNLRSYGGKLKLSSLPVKVKGLFEITKLDKLFDICPQLDEAINSF